MTKSMTNRERILLMVFIGILVVIGYLKLIAEPINNRVTAYEENAAIEQQSIDESMADVVAVKHMTEVINKAKKKGINKKAPVYDSSAELGIELQSIFSTANDYAFDFENVVKTEDLAKRPVTMTFVTDTYEQTVKIINSLHSSNHINQIADVSMNIGRDNGRTHTTMTVNFFETIIR